MISEHVRKLQAAPYMETSLEGTSVQLVMTNRNTIQGHFVHEISESWLLRSSLT